MMRGEAIMEKNDQNEQIVAETKTSNEDDVEVCLQDMDKIMALLEAKQCELESQKCKNIEAEERYKRLQADFENFRRRTRQEREDLSNFVSQAIILELLPVLDNFERAMASAQTQEVAAVLSGVEMIYRQFFSTLEKNGLEAVAAVGCPFDPNQHEAVMRVEDSEQEDGIVIQELQKGYAVKGKVIRPSMVKVVGH